jgi:hypothetical protein
MGSNSQKVTGPRKPPIGFMPSAVVFGLCIVVVSACASPSSQQRLTAQSRTTSNYIAAKKEWLAEGKVIGSASQSVPIEKALADLERGEMTDSGNKSAYAAIIAALKNFAIMPDAMVTPAQRAQGRADTVKIDRFFHIDGNQPCARWPSSRTACWEPAVSHS